MFNVDLAGAIVMFVEKLLPYRSGDGNGLIVSIAFTARKKLPDRIRFANGTLHFLFERARSYTHVLSAGAPAPTDFPRHAEWIYHTKSYALHEWREDGVEKEIRAYIQELCREFDPNMKPDQFEITAGIVDVQRVSFRTFSKEKTRWIIDCQKVQVAA